MFISGSICCALAMQCCLGVEGFDLPGLAPVVNCEEGEITETCKVNNQIKLSSRWDYIFESMPQTNIQWYSFIYPSKLDVTEGNNFFVFGHHAVLWHFWSPNSSLFDDLDFSITNFLLWIVISCHIPPSSIYGVFISKLIRYARASTRCSDFVLKAQRLADKLPRLGYVRDRLKKSHRGRSVVVMRFVLGVFFLLNLVLRKERSTAKRFPTLTALLSLWFGISVLLTFLGSYFGFSESLLSIHDEPIGYSDRYLPSHFTPNQSLEF